MSATSNLTLSDIPAAQLTLIKSQVREELEPIIRSELTLKLNEENSLALTKFKDDLRRENEVGFRDALTKFEEEERKKRTPLTPEEIQKLLTKEYVTFSVKVQDESNKTYTFSIRELPQAIEMELYSKAKTIIVDLLKNYNAISFKVVDTDLFQNILSLMELFEPVQSFLTHCCTVSLNPRNSNDLITEEWVRNNLSNYRIVAIITAQVEVSKMRDFFSILFQGFQGQGIQK